MQSKEIIYDEVEGQLTLHIPHHGFWARFVQKFFGKPEVTYIHMDEYGSAVWRMCDGQKNLITIGEELKKQFGEEVEPLYPRLVTYVRSLAERRLIKLIMP